MTRLIQSCMMGDDARVGVAKHRIATAAADMERFVHETLEENKV